MNEQGLPSWSRRARVLGSLDGLPSHSLRPGRDLALHAAPALGSRLAYGVLLDDWLDPVARARVDAEAIDEQRRWSERYGSRLTVDGVRLDWIHEGELFADVFLRERRIVAGLRAAFGSGPPAHVELCRVDDDLATALTALLDEVGVASVERTEPAPRPSYPIAFATSVGRNSPWAARIRETVGLPNAVRGSTLYKPHPNLARLLARMAVGRPVPVIDPFDAPPSGARALLEIVARGGWVGHPGGRARRRSRAAVDRALAGLTPEARATERFVTSRARALLEQRSRETLATVGVLRSAFAGTRLRSAVIPSDGSPAGRSIVTAARDHGARTVHVQHGFFGDLWHGTDGRIAPFVDGLAADRAAVWSEHQARLLSEDAEGRIVVTGNPAAGDDPRQAQRHAPGHRRRAVVLVQPPVGATCTIDVRAPVVHAAAALAGLESAGFAHAVLRPHPLDPCGYERQLTAAAGLEVTVVRGGRIESVLAEADACVGCLSTATLQAAVAGVPTVFLQTLSAPAPWPFDGSRAFPTVRTPNELAEALGDSVGRPGTAGREAAIDALGVRPDAVERVLDLVAGD